MAAAEEALPHPGSAPADRDDRRRMRTACFDQHRSSGYSYDVRRCGGRGASSPPAPAPTLVGDPGRARRRGTRRWTSCPRPGRGQPAGRRTTPRHGRAQGGPHELGSTRPRPGRACVIWQTIRVADGHPTTARDRPSLRVALPVRLATTGGVHLDDIAKCAGSALDAAASSTRRSTRSARDRSATAGADCRWSRTAG